MRSKRYAYVERYARNHPGTDADGFVDCLNVYGAQRAMQTQMDRYFGRWGLRSTTFWVLINVLSRREDPISPAELAEEIGLSRPSMTAALDVLERKGYIRRASDQTDRRRIKIRITPQGERFMAKAFPIHYRDIMRAAGYLTKAERKTLLRLHEKAAEGVKDLLKESG